MPTPILSNQGLILARTEANYGVDAVPIPALNSVFASSVNPSADLPVLERDFFRASLARLPHVVGRKLQKLDFGAELKGSPALGMRPEWGPLARAAGFQETVAGTVTSIRTAALKWTVVGATEAFYVDLVAGGDPTLANPETVRENGDDMTRASSLAAIRRGQFWYGDPASLGYSTVVVRLSDGADPDGKALGYLNHVDGTKVAYAPRSTGFESATIKCYPGGLLHHLTGCFGEWTMEFRAGQYSKWTFRETGLYLDVTDQAIPTGSNFHDLVPPVGESMAITLDAWADGVVRSLTINGGVQFAERLDLNSAEGFLGSWINKRSITGTLVIEAVTEAAYAFWAKAKAGTTATFAATLGTSPSKITLAAPKAQFGAPTWQDDNGIRTYSVPLFFNQDVADADDDFLIELL